MNSHALPRLMIGALSLILVTTGLAAAPVAAVETSEWSDTVNRENVLVQDCRGPSIVSKYSPTLAFGLDFEISTSYTTDTEFSIFADYTGIDHQVMERRFVSFEGTAVNSKTGFGLAYDGYFTRTADYAQEDFTITDLALHLDPSNADEVTIRVERETSGPIENPEAVLLAYAPRGLNTSLCGFFAGLKLAG